MDCNIDAVKVTMLKYVDSQAGPLIPMVVGFHIFLGVGMPLLDEAGDRVARLRTLADPIRGAIQLQGEIFALLERLVGADFLNALAVARAAAVGHHNAEHRGVFRADPFHANFYRHKCFKRAGKLSTTRYFASFEFEKNGAQTFVNSVRIVLIFQP